jgi:hypothetical protein
MSSLPFRSFDRTQGMQICNNRTSIVGTHAKLRHRRPQPLTSAPFPRRQQADQIRLAAWRCPGKTRRPYRPVRLPDSLVAEWRAFQPSRTVQVPSARVRRVALCTNRKILDEIFPASNVLRVVYGSSRIRLLRHILLCLRVSTRRGFDRSGDRGQQPKRNKR